MTTSRSLILAFVAFIMGWFVNDAAKTCAASAQTSTTSGYITSKHTASVVPVVMNQWWKDVVASGKPRPLFAWPIKLDGHDFVEYRAMTDAEIREASKIDETITWPVKP